MRWYRIELLREDRVGAGSLIRRYADLLAGRQGGETLWRELRALGVLGVTRGPLGRE